MRVASVGVHYVNLVIEILDIFVFQIGNIFFAEYNTALVLIIFHIDDFVINHYHSQHIFNYKLLLTGAVHKIIIFRAV